MMKGEVWWADLGSTVGHEQYGRRPVIVLRSIEGLVISVPLTTNIKRASSQFNIVHYPDGYNKLPSISVSLLSHIRSLDRRRFKERIGKLTLEDIQGLDQILKNLPCL